MPNDNVLRCMAILTMDGEQGVHVVDAIERGDKYALVLEWASTPGREGEFPKRTIGLPKSHFQIVSNPTEGFELVLTKPLNIDALIFPSVEVDGRDAWAEPKNLFTPRPND